MQKLSILLVLLLLAISSDSFCQNNTKQPTVTVTLGNITRYGPDGKLLPYRKVTRAEILANPQLTTPPPPCDIAEFTFSVLPKGKDFRGPYTVKGAWLTPDIIKMLEEVEEGDCKIFIENMKVNCGNQLMNGNSILLTMTTK